MRATLFILLWILLFESILGTTYLYQRGQPLPFPEPESTLFGLIPPQPAKVIKEALTYQTVPLFYPSQGIILNVPCSSAASGLERAFSPCSKVEGDMLLAHINKIYALPSWYVPSGLVSLSGEVKTIGPEVLRKTVLPYLKDLFTTAEKACGCKLAVLSTYRSYQTQVAVYNYWVNQVGQYYADLGSARPGHSEHQLGTAVDFTSSTVSYQLTRDFGFTCEGNWLENNAHKYGFVLSYPKGKDGITGYIWEPWHFRYVGKVVAREVYTRGMILEEYLLSR